MMIISSFPFVYTQGKNQSMTAREDDAELARLLAEQDAFFRNKEKPSVKIIRKSQPPDDADGRKEALQVNDAGGGGGGGVKEKKKEDAAMMIVGGIVEKTEGGM